MEISRHGITMLIAFAIALTGVTALLFLSFVSERLTLI